ncbi:MAG: glycoside hydrolase, partial [Paraprevotella sp.]|nr:glycoside hydrolase [Paraprevotella sp.]
KGYLSGPYDSYHSIHKPGHEEWSTASFRDTTLYDQASIRRQDGSYMSGFKGVGRYLNPIYSMGEVIYRTHKILSTGVPFNSWFIDCDATGEVHDDYTPHHESNKQQNIEARLRRMAYIRDTLQMVIGSEGGNDFACGTISFAHGVDLPTFTWMDKEMKDKESPYFVGAYYSPTEGEVPSVYARQVPVKTRFYDLFLNPTYAVPLYKLVYNPVIVTANHWEWPSLKIREAVKERMLYEISYNAAPLYHLSVKEWNAHKRTIIRHVRIWSRIHEKAIRMPMTDFRYLSDDKQVQQTAFGNDLIITTNYSDKTFRYGSHEIPPRSAWIESDGKSLMYTPQD